EAHELEEIAGQYFGVAVSSYRFEELGRDIAAVARGKKVNSADLERALNNLADAAGFFFGLLPQIEGRASFTGRAAFLEQRQEQYRDLLNSLEWIRSQLNLMNLAEEADPLVRRAAELTHDLRFIMESDDRSYVYWMERRGRGCFLQATPIDVSSLLAQRLFS